ncbi:metallophosphoesterase [Lacibacter sp.]|uniref:metallophosphoesterase n=1 Tax=Lacibacter sp. TaxID=1915409 RepID=UPI002B4B4515|nr:metallophosphoesterase [Lacibacter sp.]HLP35468.1 metallophosphoesterase [Lacibacter sp.]
MQSPFRKTIVLLVFVLGYQYQQAQVLVKDSSALPKAGTKLIKKEKALHFIAMGDWGRNGADHQREVARQMGITANEIGSMFTIATGDNFYPSGVISEWDPLWKYSFEDIYTDFRLQWDWYPVLGNHDYKSNPDAQVKYSTISRRWKMPARYYSKIFSINGDTTQQVLLVFIDTNPLIREFYKNAEYGPHVKGQDTTKQKRWMEKLLSNKSPNIKWKIVVGHHPMYTGGSRTEGYDTKAIRNTLKPMFDKYKVDVYLAGHEHSLQHMQSAGNMHHIISGAASEKTPARLIENSLLSASEYGFFVFSVTGNELLFQAVNDTGKIIYTYTIKK